MFVGFCVLLYWREQGLWEYPMHMSPFVTLFVLTFEELANFNAI